MQQSLRKYAASIAGEGEYLGRTVYCKSDVYLIEYEGKQAVYTIDTENDGGIEEADFVTEEELADLRCSLV